MPLMPSLPPLPGFGSPLSYGPTKDVDDRCLFPSALDNKMSDPGHSARLPAFTLRELKMVEFMNVVTDKPGWEDKVFDESIVQRWKREAGVEDQKTKDGNKGDETEGGEKAHGETVQDVGEGEQENRSDGAGDNNGGENEGDEDDGPSFSENMFQYCIDELRYKAELYKRSGFVQVFTGDVIKSDTAITSDLQELLKLGVASLEDVPKNKQDWHPGSNDQVLDLVHPSLFPLVYGLSRVLPDTTTNIDDCIGRCGAGEVIPEISRTENVGDAYSKRFQWLPCDVDISGNTPKILSYINNLHPQKHTDLYQVIEEIIAKVIPLWNATLSPSQEVEFPQRIVYLCAEYDDPAWQKYLEDNGPKQEEGEDENDFEDRQHEWEQHEGESDHKRKFYLQPDVQRNFSPPEDDWPSVDLKGDFGATGLQVIVKLANIHLTPEKPEYPGGTWHVEGQLNEHICATAIYYYDVKNISDTYLHFRQAVNTEHLSHDVSYEQNDNYWLEDIYGLQNWEPCVQEVGGIEAREGRLITFPNILQHQVRPFHLADPTKPGHRKILALFLVDPSIKIISTANVPCQRHDWWAQMVLDSDVLAKLPLELRDLVVQDFDMFPMSLEQAKKLREELMEERKEYVIGYQSHTFRSATISLCEH